MNQIRQICIVHFNLLENNISEFIFRCKKSLNKDFHLFKIFTSSISPILIRCNSFVAMEITKIKCDEH
jgi:hypothetical protein